MLRINVCFWETDHLPLPQPNIHPYFSLWTKCWPRGGVGGQFPRKHTLIRCYLYYSYATIINVHNIPLLDTLR